MFRGEGAIRELARFEGDVLQLNISCAFHVELIKGGDEQYGIGGETALKCYQCSVVIHSTEGLSPGALQNTVYESTL